MIVGVRYTPSGPVRYFEDAGISLSFDDRVLVQTPDGEREARVAIGSGQAIHSDIEGALPRVIRVIERARKIP